MNKILLIAGAALLIGLTGGYSFSKVKPVMKNAENYVSSQNADGQGMGNKNSLNTSSKNREPNRGNCLSDDCLLVDNLEYPAGNLTDDVQQALNDAIDDEYKAHATYEAVIEKFGSVRPFSMIIGAEEQHIASLKTIFDKYGIDVPEDTWTGTVDVPETLKEACQTGVDAEIANADLYKNDLMPAVKKYADITGVFTNLMNASQQKHLPAFDRCN